MRGAFLQTVQLICKTYEVLNILSLSHPFNFEQQNKTY